MTPKEIADHLRAQKTFDVDTMAPLDGYTQTKRATGAPVDLERSIRAATAEVESAVYALQEHVESSRRELGNLAHYAMQGAQFKARNYALPQHKPTEFYLSDLAGKQAHLNTLLDLWVSLADRIVATDEDRAAYAAKRRQFKIDELSNRSARDLRALAKAQGLKVGTNCREIAEQLVDAGYEP